MKEKVFFRNDCMRQTEDGIRIVASRCPECGSFYFPPEAQCRRDLCKDMEEVLAPRYGTIYSFSVFYRGCRFYKGPYAIAQVDFDNGLRIEGQLLIEDPATLQRGQEFRIGSKVEMYVDTLWEDDEKEYIGYKFKVIEEPKEV